MGQKELRCAGEDGSGICASLSLSISAWVLRLQFAEESPLHREITQPTLAASGFVRVPHLGSMVWAVRPFPYPTTPLALVPLVSQH